MDLNYQKRKYSIVFDPLSVVLRFLSISVANVEVDFGPDCSTVTKQDHGVDIPMYTLFTEFHS